MSTIKRIQFLYFSGCPLAEPARKNLAEALIQCGLSDFEEIDILKPDSPEDLRGWGSPTILLNGEDVTGQPKGNSVSCRIYPFEGGVPDAQTIASAIKATGTV
ncbi:MAG: hypothetical protein AB8C46_24285 [Burkholderiaceae bacterium]